MHDLRDKIGIVFYIGDYWTRKGNGQKRGREGYDNAICVVVQKL